MLFRLHDATGIAEIDVPIREVIIAGMTGRDEAAVQKHVDELAELGVSPPSEIPIYYRVSASHLTTEPRIQVVGSGTSGEVEAVLIGTGTGMLVGLGSDHTDREVEAQSIALSKQLCPKPISRDVWSYSDVAKHWDTIRLLADRVEAGRWEPYQRGKLGAVRKPADLIGRFFPGLEELPAGVVMFSGTIATEGAIRGADHFSMALVDEKTGRSLWHAYDTAVLPNVA